MSRHVCSPSPCDRYLRIPQTIGLHQLFSTLALADHSSWSTILECDLQPCPRGRFAKKLG